MLSAQKPYVASGYHIRQQSLNYALKKTNSKISTAQQNKFTSVSCKMSNMGGQGLFHSHLRIQADHLVAVSNETQGQVLPK